MFAFILKTFEDIDDPEYKIIEEGAGTDFDPNLVPLFFGAKKKVIAYYNVSKEKDNDLS